MTPKTYPDDDNMVKAMLAGLNAEMLKAAEPIIQQALKDAERQMRERMAALLIARIEQSVEFHYDRDRLVIEIRRPAP